MIRLKLFNTRYIVDIKKFKIRTTMLIAILCSFFIFDFISSLNNKTINYSNIKYEPVKIQFEEYTVVSGDTLWNIAETFYPEKNNREIIDLIKKDNFCNADLKIGQVLYIRKNI